MSLESQKEKWEWWPPHFILCLGKVLFYNLGSFALNVCIYIYVIGYAPKPNRTVPGDKIYCKSFLVTSAPQKISLKIVTPLSHVSVDQALHRPHPL